MSVRRRCAAAALAWLCLVSAGVAETSEPPEPSDYRQSEYRAPTPATLQGARVLTTAEAHALWLSGGASFVDVLPQPPRPPALPAGTIWQEKPRFDIPGSVWLPDTGYGALAPALDAYFHRGLRAARAGHAGRLLVFYCLADCWMSWNAAKRAVAAGFAPVAWYRDGTTGWAKAGYALERRMAQQRPAP